MKNLIYFFAFVLISFFNIYSQNPEWVVYNTSNSGLPSDTVNAIAIDGNGNKWIGTYDRGLAKFDGTNWTVYDTSNSVAD